MAVKKRAAGLVAAAAALALGLSACSSSTTGGSDSGEGGALSVGTTDKVTVLDPAGSYDNGSFFVMQQVFPFLMEYKPGTSEIREGIAESADFVKPNEYEVKLKKDLKFANGNDLTASDVKFSFERQTKIQDPNGPASLLTAIESIDTPDDHTVVFKLNRENDQTFPLVLAGPAGPVVDEDVFAADAITKDDEIVKGKAFAGPYEISTYKFNELVTYKKYDGYDGGGDAAKSAEVQMKYYSDANNMKLDVEKGSIDVAYRSLSPTDIADLEGKDNLTVHKGPGGEIRYIVFNFDTMPHGAKSDNPDEKKALAIRQAMASSIDRAAIAKDVYKDTYQPLYSYVPEGMQGANESLKGLYGDKQGGADADAAKKFLEDAGVETPVNIKLQYNPDHYGPSSGDEYAAVKKQLEDTGLFKVDLQSTEWVQYAKDRSNDVYPMYQLGWFPDYSDGDNYLVPFFYNTEEEPAFLANHFQDDSINKKLLEQVSQPDAGKREQLISDIQDDLAKQLPTLPLLQGNQIAVADKNVKGVDETLDPSFQFRLSLLSK